MGKKISGNHMNLKFTFLTEKWQLIEPLFTFFVTESYSHFMGFITLIASNKKY